MLKVFGFVLAVLGLGLAGPAWAQARNPVLIGNDIVRTGDASETRPLPIGRLDISVDIAGASARTVITVQFLNPASDELEGDFTLDLPAGAIVTGYALDVGEAMIDGVLVGRRQGVEAYEAKVREGIDPGLAEVTRTNALRTRVFPVLPGKGRTIRLEFVSPLNPSGAYVLPLSVPEPIGAVALKVTSDVRGAQPPLKGPDGLKLSWSAGPRGLEASAAGKDVRLAGALEVGPIARAEPVLMSRHHSGDVFFEIDDAASGRADPAAVSRARIYWDTSVSRRDDDLAAEIDLVRRYLEAAGPRAIDLVLFSDSEPVVRGFTGAAEVEAALKAVEYRGATSIAGLFRLKLPRAGACLYLSDGSVTLDSYRAERAGCPLFAVSSAPDADRAFLEALARKSGGDYVDLKSRSAAEALPILLRQAPRVVSVQAMDQQEVDYRVLPAAPGRFRIVGRAPLSAQVTVRLAGTWDGARTYALNARRPRDHDGAGAIWALGEIAERTATDQPDQDAIVAFARRYSVASPAAVFIVLESAEDYAEADIAPPPMVGEAFLAEYRQLVVEREAEEAEARADRLEKVIEEWQDRKAWWKTRFPSRPPRPKAPAIRDTLSLEAAPVTTAAAAPPPAPVGMTREGSGGDVDALIVTAQRREGNLQDVPIAISQFVRTITIEAADWNPDRPYLKALAAAAPEAFWSVYREQEKAHGALPAFYLDVGEFLFRAGRAKDALSVVVGALELPSADAGTLTIVADRLMRYGDPARGVWLYEKILFLDPDRPQPRRNLALALIQRAETGGPRARPRRDYLRALDLLREVALTPWDGSYDGIELISLMEANRIAPRLRALGETPDLDPRLTALMDVDLRVVLEWTTDATDMDLWVKEPSGEQAMYSHKLTGVGGAMSNDMTDGYGPEEYLLRRAPRGRYEVRVNVYRVDRLSPNGVTTVRARIFRNWGRPDESSEMLELDLKREDSGGQLVGVATVSSRPGR